MRRPGALALTPLLCWLALLASGEDSWGRPALAPLGLGGEASPDDPSGGGFSGRPSAQGVARSGWSALIAPPACGSTAAPDRSAYAERTAARGAAPPLVPVRASVKSSDSDLTLHPFGLIPVTREPPLGSLDEWIVAVRLLGPGDVDLRTLDDFDVLVRPGEERWWPLLRFLSAIGEQVEVLEADEQGPLRFSFFAAGTRKVEVSVPSGTVHFGLEARPAELLRRRSEFTRAPEVYVPEAVVAEALGYRVDWNELALEIVARSDTYPQWYIEKQRNRTVGWASIKEVPPNLPELRPPAQPRDWSLDFAEVSLSGAYSASQNGKDKEFELYRPGERLWGRAGGGFYRLDLSQKGFVRGTDRSPAGPDLTMDRAWWQTETRRDALALGDAELGLGELVFPGVDLTGLRWGHGGKAGASRAFLPEVTVEDSAPLDSQVDLYVNDGYVKSLRVRDPLKDLPGFGFFRFEGVALIPGRENTLRMIVTEPSGYRRELVRTVWGSDKVLTAGDSAWLVGAGTNRDKISWDSHGTFAGGLLRYGLTEQLTGETTAGYQSRFLPEAVQGAPEESAHVGAGLAWQPYHGGFVRGDLAKSWDPEGSSTGWAARVRGELQAGPVQLRPDVFRYGSDFFDGQNPSLRDREGAWLSAQWPVTGSVSLLGSAGSLRNNLDGDEPKTLRETIEHVEARISGLLPRTRLSLGADYIQQHWEGGERPALYSAILESTPTPKIQVEARVYEGDRFDTSEHLGLVGAARLANLPFYESPYNGGRILWWAAPGVSATVAHWNYRTRKESLLGLGLAGSRGLRWDFQSEVGKTWDKDVETLADTLVWRGRLGLYLNRAGNRRLSLQSDYQRRAWSVSMLFNFLEVFGFDGLRPVWLTAQGVNPMAGLVMGRVFLDRNGDGLPQDGENGIANVRVVMGSQQAQTDEDGHFVFPRAANPEGERISLDMRELDALYTPTNGTQIARVKPGSVSKVELGVAILGSVVGKVQRLEPDGSTRPVPGATVGLYDGDGAKVNASVTAADGSFHLGEVKPGLYWVQVEGSSLPEPLAPRTPPQKISVVSGDEAPVDQVVDFLVAPEAAPPPLASGAPAAAPKP